MPPFRKLPTLFRLKGVRLVLGSPAAGRLYAEAGFLCTQSLTTAMSISRSDCSGRSALAFRFLPSKEAHHRLHSEELHTGLATHLARTTAWATCRAVGNLMAASWDINFAVPMTSSFRRRVALCTLWVCLNQELISKCKASFEVVPEGRRPSILLSMACLMRILLKSHCRRPGAPAHQSNRHSGRLVLRTIFLTASPCMAERAARLSKKSAGVMKGFEQSIASTILRARGMCILEFPIHLGAPQSQSYLGTEYDMTR